MISKKKILVTGAGGFIGSHLARELYRADNTVRAVDMKWDGYLKERYFDERMTLDLRTFDNCLKATEGVDYVFNLAANMGGIGYITSTGAEVMYDNVTINASMLEASVKNYVKRFFFSSSACIYPTFRQESAEVVPLKEEDAYPADPDNYYGWEKLYSEKMMEAYQRDHSLAIRIARYHNIYGPEGTFSGGKEKSPAALCRKIAEAEDGGEIEIWGDGKQTRSYCYIDDCVAGTIRLMASDFVKPLNIGSDRLVSIDELADIICRVSGKRIRKRYDVSAPQGVRGRNADLTLLQQVLSWQPRVTLEQGLGTTYQWIEKQVMEVTAR